jgi:hypothetical protein
LGLWFGIFKDLTTEGAEGAEKEKRRRDLIMRMFG